MSTLVLVKIISFRLSSWWRLSNAYIPREGKLSVLPDNSFGLEKQNYISVWPASRMAGSPRHQLLLYGVSISVLPDLVFRLSQLRENQSASQALGLEEDQQP